MVLSDSDDEDLSSGSYVSGSSSEPKAAAAPKKKSFLDDSDSEEMDLDDDAISDSDDEAPVAATPPKKSSFVDDSDDDEDISDSDDEPSRLPPKTSSADVSDSGSDADAISDSEEEPVKSEPNTSSYLDDDDSDNDSDGKILDSSGGSNGKRKKGGSGGMDLDSGHDLDMGGDVDENDDDAISDSEEEEPTKNNNTDIDAGGGLYDDAISNSSDDDPLPGQDTDPPSPASDRKDLPPKKKSFMDDSDSDVSDDESTMQKASEPEPPAPKKKSFLDDSDSDDDDDSTSEPVKKASAPAPTPPAPAPKKKSTFDSDSDDGDSTSEPVKEASAPAPKPAAPVPKKKSAFDSDSDSDDSTSEPVKKAQAPAPKKKSTFDSDSDSDDSTSEKVKKAPAPSASSPPVKKKSVLDSDSDSDDSASEPVKKSAAATPAPVAKDKSVSGDSDDGAPGFSSDPSEPQGEAQQCSACGEKAAYASGGMVTCTACHNVSFRSSWSNAANTDNEALYEQPEACKACGMESEYVSEGMLPCPKCDEVVYCTVECQEWDWKEHKDNCPGITEEERRVAVGFSLDVINEAGELSDQGSIEAFDANVDSAPQSQEGIMAALARSRAEAATTAQPNNSSPATSVPTPESKRTCRSCHMEEEFVPEGMIRCSRCSEVSYCSVDCMEWHWDHGGHNKECRGATEAMPGDNPVNTVDNESDGSIEAFGADEDEDGPPQSHEGILAALSKSRAEASNTQTKPQSLTATTQSTLQDKCRACGMEKEFVSEGLIMCSMCSQVPYCSVDCMKWDWDQGSHRHNCRGATNADREIMLGQPAANAKNANDSESSIDVFDPNVGDGDAPTSQEGILAALAAARIQSAAGTKKAEPTVSQNACIACDMDKEFVPEGLLTCPKCSQVAYCSTDCMEWHWNSGGHKNDCAGTSITERNEIAQRNSNGESDGSIEPFDPNAGDDAPQSKEGVLAALSKARADATASRSSALSSNPTTIPQKSNTQKIECKGCGMDEEFVSEGMQMCTRCKLVPYCSLDCMSWHWEKGGHSITCPGLSDAERHAKNNAKAVDPNVAARAKEEALICKACGMDKEFVPDGMQMCPKCSTVAYCSDECMQWDWNSGGHKDKCKGASAADKNLPKVIPDTQEGDSDGSLDAFGAIEGEDETPQNKGGVLAALAKARAEVAKPPAAAIPTYCKACKMEEEFVPEGMKKCPNCLGVSYCSDDCMEWDWNYGDHKGNCTGAPPVGGKHDDRAVEVDQKSDSDGSVDVFGAVEGEDETPQNKGGVLAALAKARAEVAKPPAAPACCKACGMEEEFVPEGMKMCPNCLGVSYCSDDCLKWDWESGGHKSTCPGTSSQKQESEVVIQGGGSDSSIDAFGANGDSGEVPQSQAGVLAALSKAREEASQKKSPSSEGQSSLRDQITGGKDVQQAKALHKPQPRPASGETPPTSGLSLRDQITGGNDVQQSRDVVGTRPPTVSTPRDTSMLKVELERTKRQYNDAMLSKAALERALSNSSQVEKPAPVPLQRSHDGMSSSIESFLSRLEGLLEADRNNTRSQMEGLAQGSNLVPVGGALAQSVTELENSIRGLIAKSNQAAAEKDALKKALIDAAGNKTALSHGSAANIPGQLRGGVAPRFGKGDGIEAGRGKDALMGELNDKWDSLVAESDYFKAQLYRTARERDQLKADKEASGRLVQEKEALLEEVCKTIVDLENEVSRIYGEQKVLESENEALRGQLDQLTRELAQMHINRESSDNLLNEKEALLSKLAKIMMELETQVLRIDGEKKTLEDELHQANSALVKHREAKSRLEKSFNNTEREVQGLRRHLHEVDTALEATRPGYSMDSAVSSKADIPTPREFLKPQVLEVRAVDEGKNISRAPATKYTAQAPRRTPLSYSDRVASLNLPSQRQDAVGRAIRERTGASPTPLAWDTLKNSTFASYEPNWTKAEPGPAAIPAEEWNRAVSGRQRDDVREPKGKRFLHTYVQPTNSEVQARVTNPSRIRRDTGFPNMDKRDRLPPAPSFPPPPQRDMDYGSARKDQSEENREPRYIDKSGSRDGNYKGRVQEDDARQNLSRDGPRTTTMQPREEPSMMKNSIVAQMPLTPTEQRMAIIQQRIARAVEAAKRKASTSPSPQQPNYSYQPHGEGSSQTSLRPQYGKKSDKDSIFRDQHGNNQSRPSSKWWDPHSRPTAQMSGHSQPVPGQPLPRTTIPTYNHPAPRSSARNVSSPFKPPVPPTTRFVVYPTQGVTGHRSRNDPTGGYQSSSRTPRESQQGPPRYVIHGPPGHSAFSAANRPRYAMTHHVDPKNLQKVRDERWRKVLDASSILS